MQNPLLSQSIARFAPPIPLAFLVGVPVGISLLYSLVGAGELAHHLPPWLAFPYWVGLLLPKWWVQYATTLLLNRILLPRSLWPLLILGGAIGGVVFQPYGAFYIAQMQSWLASHIPESERVMVEVLWPTAPAQIIGTGAQHLASIGVWCMAGVIGARLAGFPSFRIMETPARNADSGADPAPADVPLGFADRLTDIEPDGIIAIQAADHYIRVYSAHHEELVYYQFARAVAELTSAGRGMRVHRSFWVATSAAVTEQKYESGYRLQLVNGTKVPVGRSYVEAARQAGMISS
jgi:hypothetical protein